MRYAAILAVAAVLSSCGPSSSAATSTPTAGQAASTGSVMYVPQSSEKVCQLNGETDRQINMPTVNQTASRYGLVGDDNGSSFVYNSMVFFLFGDSIPTATFRGRPNGPDDLPRIADDNDAIAFTSSTTITGCPKLTYTTDSIGAYKNPVVLNSEGEPAITLRTNEVPIAGIGEDGAMYVLFSTDNSYANPPPGGTVVPDSGGTRSVLAVSRDGANTFTYLYDFSAGPNAKFINTAIYQGDDGYVYFWGTPGGLLYRKSAPYLARKPADQLGQSGGMQYFTGMSSSGSPIFSNSESAAVPLFHDVMPGSSVPHDCMGELSVAWNPFVERWIMLYNCANDSSANPSGIYMRVAKQPWGPWSAPQTIFNSKRDGGLCHFIHRAVTASQPACDQLSGPERLDVPGGIYGPYMITSMITGDARQGMSTLYYTMSTWNPYVVVVMRSMIRVS
jgi:Domain of unknown function (DUF4185)